MARLEIVLEDLDSDALFHTIRDLVGERGLEVGAVVAVEAVSERLLQGCDLTGGERIQAYVVLAARIEEEAGRTEAVRYLRNG